MKSDCDSVWLDRIHCSVYDWILKNVRITRCIGPFHVKPIRSSITIHYHSISWIYIYSLYEMCVEFFFLLFHRKHANLIQTHARRINSSIHFVWHCCWRPWFDLRLCVCKCVLNGLNHTVYETSKCDSWLPNRQTEKTWFYTNIRSYSSAFSVCHTNIHEPTALP